MRLGQEKEDKGLFFKEEHKKDNLSMIVVQEVTKYIKVLKYVCRRDLLP
jgi:hypothetical protein